MLAQLNLMVGDLEANAGRVAAQMDAARAAGAHLLVFPELTLSGYPPEDLLLRPGFVTACRETVERLAAHSRGLTALVGFPHHRGDELFNAAAVLHDGQLADIYHKAYLPNYGVFDEQRYFGQGERFPVLDLGGVKIGVSICEDIWYAAGPPQVQALAGAEVLVNLSASPFHAGKRRYREQMLATRAGDTGAYVVFCNLVGGQDELVFDGNSLVLDTDGQVVARGASMAEDVFCVDLRPDEVLRDRLLDPRIRKARLMRQDPALSPELVLEPVADLHAGALDPLPERVEPTPLDGSAEIWAGLVLGLRDYVTKNGFSELVLGLSGGIDSAVTAALAVDALGADRVHGVAMPARYSSPESLADAEALAALAGLPLLTIPIDAGFQAFLDLLAPAFADRAEDLTEENLQSRVRGTVVMALSNKFGWLPLTTGNKSEMSVGYATLYGDMAGGFAPLKDVSKLRVYALARWRNTQGAIIPEHSIQRPPSAELRPEQLDSDSLPPYELLDPILAAYVEREASVEEIVALGFERAMVERIAGLVDRSEYKRRQSPPGVKISQRAFGRERRMPITKRVRTGGAS
ncbi:MAG: NAD+ synthase [Caldilineae bacterium]|nr:NAD+ synthase [Caldilineae bacterium]